MMVLGRFASPPTMKAVTVSQESTSREVIAMILDKLGSGVDKEQYELRFTTYVAPATNTCAVDTHSSGLFELWRTILYAVGCASTNAYMCMIVFVYAPHRYVEGPQGKLRRVLSKLGAASKRVHTLSNDEAPVLVAEWFVDHVPRRFELHHRPSKERAEKV